MKQRRVVVTGLGVVSPVGIGADASWEALIAGRSGIADITLFDASPFEVRVAGEVKGFDATRYMDARDVRRHDRNTHFAVAAAGEALRSAGLLGPDDRLDASQADPGRFGIVMGTGIGGIGMISDGLQTLRERGPSRVSPFLLPHMIPDAASGMVAIQYGIRGHNLAVVSACATGGHAIGEAMEAIVRGQADLMLGAGTEAVVVPLALAGFSQMKALGTPIDPDTGEYDPAVASRPFDATRNGFVVSEGAAVLVMEEAEHAAARGVTPLAEVIGYGSSADAFHMAAPAERGEGNARAMRAALARAGIGPEEVDYINAHGTSTPLNDRYESVAIEDVFGEHARKLAVSSTKSMTGHMMGAAGAFEGFVCVKVVQTGCLPPTINYRHPDPELTLDYVPNTARQTDARVALSNSMGLGGHNSTVIFRRWEADA
ncbi:MAG TPA: beta-ketoacyl-ACP synthase II [candidate division Zixibacteria bacterium]|nr:beta-ketoacyl-ACP synthase II [candidate division Zixibacteria bacterium]